MLDNPTYRQHALAMADEFADIDTRTEVLRIIHRLAQAPNDEAARQDGEAAVVHRRRARAGAR